ncbi:regulator of G-protein signaling loco isoform X3 [Athalia rosae]|uniref:regulator of G-protein signaling loco isoform X3 n=1 Tax=Athalia rosae TaxID=37344 RepID=UPI002033E771|nr:regulator of G-protein signaling loco isoform X3 [Athalia rosae]
MNMHHNRRKKKRVNYGVRVVELLRGSKGFGFTISGQQPCILSCIVQGSPAENAGLRAGDYLVAVNGHSVSKIPHDDVVRLIGNSKGILRLQIAENYYSDSSDEEGLATVRSKPKYSHKPRTNAVTPAPLQCRIAKVVRDLHSGAMFDAANRNSQNKIQCSHSSLHHRWNMASPLPPPPPPLSLKRDTEKIVHRTVVGYLGTIDIPNQLPPSSMMQVLRKCIKRLKAEKRNPTTVLLTIHVANIKLTNSDNKVIAEYPSFRIIFCNSFSELDKQYFGILTKSVKDNDDIVSNSCHVFTIYYKLIDHAVHSSTCNIFGFTCTKTSELNVCQEFPDSCNGLIGAIQTLYISDTDSESNPYNEEARHHHAASPQPSNVSTSTAHSSNSDSGIGFKDDYGNQSDRNMMADFQERRQYLPNIHVREANTAHSKNGLLSRPRPNESSGSKLTVRAVPDVEWMDDARSNQSRDAAFSFEVNGKHGVSNSGKISNNGEGFGVSMASGMCGDESVDRRGNNTCLGPSAPTLTSMGLPSLMATSEGTQKQESTRAKDILGSQENLDFAINNDRKTPFKCTNDSFSKLSLKVYGVSKSLVHSFEDLKPTMECSSLLHQCSKNEKPRWGSLQEIRNVGNCTSNNCLHRSIESFEKSSNCNGVNSWSSSFEKLLEDPAGLQTFAEFLKKEFSHENIYFWAACERYKDTEDVNSRKRMASQIYRRHLSSSAAEPVNVDSHAAGQITQDLLNEAPAALFLQAQKQVFNLMKFDSYPRFLRSDLYRTCMEAGSSVIRTQDCDLSLIGSPQIKLKKSHSDAEDRSRKSILPWHRKNRSKSKDRGESEYNKTPCRNETIYKSFTTMKKDVDGNSNDDNKSISSSRSSLASWDLALRQSFNKNSISSCEGHSNDKKESHSKCTGLCRVILPDGSTTVVPTSHSESIKDVVTRLLDKRALRYSNYDVLILATEETVNLDYASSILASEEVQVVLTKVLKVDLPSRRIVSIRAHRGRTLREVLRPLLNKYGFNLEVITMWGDGHPVDMDIPAINAPARLTLTLGNEEFHRDVLPLKYPDDIPHSQPRLEEITNKVFKELLVSKSTNKYPYDEGSCKSDDQRSEGSSILSNKFFLRDSTIHGKKKGKSKSSNTSEKNHQIENAADICSRPQPPLIAKLCNGVKLQLPGRYDGDGFSDLYEGLKRAQRSRLEDQRGTEINFELPEFLKNKENGKHLGKKIRRGRAAPGHIEGNTRFYDSGEDKQSASNITNFETCSTNGNDEMLKSSFHHNLVCEEVSESIDKCFDLTSPLEVTIVDVDQTLTESNIPSQLEHQECSSFKPQFVPLSPTKHSKPPPLPPKPKLLASAIKTGHILSKPSHKIVQTSTTTMIESCENKNIF